MNFPGGLMFAPESLLDDRKRRIFWSWLLDGRVSQRSELGVMTAPRVLSLDPHDGQLLIEPPAEFASLRAAQKLSVHDLTLAAGELMVADVQGDLMELLPPDEAEHVAEERQASGQYEACPGLHRVECAVFNPGSSSWICSLSPPRRRQKFVKHGITFHIRVLLKLCTFA